MIHKQAINFVNNLQNYKRKEYLKNYQDCQIYLDRLNFFLQLIGNPQNKIKHFIHIAGTSGKGSVAIMIHSILCQTKNKVGLVTSPSIGNLQNRFQINQTEISEKEFTEIIKIFKTALKEYEKTSPYDMVSYWELLTALGFYYFAKNNADWVVIETGCGGRYDSTNVIPKKDLCLITNIGLDHTQILGKTKEKIAYEKAGIIKNAKFFLTTETNKKVLKIFQKEAEKNKVKNTIIKDQYKILNENLTNLEFQYKKNNYTLPTIGEHQIKNAILAIEAGQKLKIKNKDIQKGLSKIILPLRMELVKKEPLIILDGAHNPDKVKTTIQTIKKLNKNFSKKILVLGISEDKDIKSIIKLLNKINWSEIILTQTSLKNVKKPMKPSEIKEIMLTENIPNNKITIYKNPSLIYKYLKPKIGKDDLILVTGSMYLSGELKKTKTFK